MKQLSASSLLAAISMLLSVASYGRTSINFVLYTIIRPGVFVLAKDHFYNSASGLAITINSGSVTLDFGGHFIGCSAASSQNFGMFLPNGRT